MKMILGLLLVIILAAGITQAQKPVYSCPMHPEVTSTKPGRCRKCGMDLRLVKKSADAKTNTDTKTNTAAEADAPPFSSMKIPDTPVYDQNGKELKFYSDLVKDKTVAINFIFTTCTTICPPLTATFRKVQQEAEARGLNVQLISVSVDPAVDTPERLRAFAEKFKAGPGWTFVTGDKSQIDSVLQAFGVAVANKTDHTPMILIGDDVSDYWTRTYGLSSPAKIVDMLAGAVAGRRKASFENRGVQPPHNGFDLVGSNQRHHVVRRIAVPM